MLVFLLLLIFCRTSNSLNISFSSFHNLPKCCDFDSEFVEASDSYFCEKTNNIRIAIQTNFISNYSALEGGDCVESANSELYLFSVKNNKSTIVENISSKTLPKCCPMNFLYVPSTHSCVKNESFSNQFNATFMKVGLPKCKIIFDYKFNSIRDIKIGEHPIDFSKLFSNEEYCVDETMENTIVIRVCEDYNFCGRTRCIHKCCPDGQSFVNGSHCKNTYVHGMDIEYLSGHIANVSDEFAIVHGYSTGVYIPNNYKFYLDEGGFFHTFEEKIGNKVYTPEEEIYCIEHATKGGITYGHTFFQIIPKIDHLEKKFIFNRWAMIISCIFLIMTIMYYAFSKESAKVFGKTLICFCTALLTLSMILIYCTFKPNLNVRSTMTTCKTIAAYLNLVERTQIIRIIGDNARSMREGAEEFNRKNSDREPIHHTTVFKINAIFNETGFLIIYTSFSCFIWLQIMCYDIYWTFGSSKNFVTRDERKRRDLKKSLYYCFYGWGLPLLMTLILLLFHFVDILPTSIKIRIGETKCLIDRGEGNYAEILFYISPLTVIQMINIVFFIKTVRYCWQVKGDIQRINQSADIQKKKSKFLARKERFGLIIKLSVIMGISFLFEVVSSFYDFKENVVTEYIEIIWDLFNCLQGLFIFIIFVCKKKNFKKCRSNIALDRIRKISLTSTSTKTTAVSSVRKFTQENRRKHSKEVEKNKFA